MTETEPEVQSSMVQMMESEQAADILERMEPDEAADILSDLPEEKAQEAPGDDGGGGGAGGGGTAHARGRYGRRADDHPGCLRYRLILPWSTPSGASVLRQGRKRKPFTTST
ncbi:MAG: hypothetical protein M5R38_04330 [Candidatus Methylomirabilis sp.]|nr:hypothetical protein [Candidatus Methylomirabilis sp.]